MINISCIWERDGGLASLGVEQSGRLSDTCISEMPVNVPNNLNLVV